ncbi:cilia- and flagella-associated protein 45-like [Nasonia vitripennis]|uniref:Cilia- and flagella-associated protein 45 n=1 Tax=Nasonia vitripennis TaxID=7425 RepID=A0A7M7HGM2_NASVI|nr:cilia- and flagella-associated protein 45-like [Nasonia vitripennis]XP_008216446.1 cilia- and flagella-associated protein 45-like [Nasonia vitripennis]XP_032453319.1 cilia- and flagella-associated protein 45-like [Nasonia vitripennis]
MKSASRMSARATEGKSRVSSSRSNKFPPGEYGIHTARECDQLLKNRAIHPKEVTRVPEKEGYRKLLVPSKEPTVHPKIITSSELSSLVERSHIPTKEEREAALAAAEREKERLLRESMARKEAIRQMDLRRSREKQGRMSDVEEESRQRTLHLLQRARDLKLEQEEEVKRCNKLILETKCRAVRDAQIAEKKLLERQYAAEEQRINKLVEEERIRALRLEEEKERERASRQQNFAQLLKEQILENEEERLLEQERKREESRLLNLNSLAQQEAELARMKEKEAEHEKARREFIESNEQLKHFKQMEKEESKIMEMRIQEFHREKAERAAKAAEEIRQENLRREREKDRLAEQALQARQLQAQIDELNATRIQEEVSREWRRREKAEAMKRLENQRKLRSVRDQQINSKMQMQAMEIEREKKEFDKILALQKEALCREEKEREKKRRQALVHRSEILKQVNEKEKDKIVSRQRMFEEGVAIKAETDQRKRQLREAMERKCQEMRENKVPDMYINEVKRMIENSK